MLSRKLIKHVEPKDEFVSSKSNLHLTGKSIPKFELDEHMKDSRTAYDIVHSESFFDSNPMLNMASFVNTWMEPEADKIIMENISKNFIDKPIYPQTVEIQNRCVTIIANFLNICKDDNAIGTATVGSSEAIHLAGLVLKWKWKRWAEGKNLGKPQIIMGTNVQICWKKFATYFEVEPVEIPIDRENRINVDKVITSLNNRTIAVVGILGNTYSGEYDNISLLNQKLDEYNKDREWKIPIHVDAASGGFVAPFISDQKKIPWDFRLKWVKSINISGHKFGLVYPGIGWAIWRDENDIDEELIFKIKYLGEEQDDFGLNFSRNASNIFAQYYNFVRYGKEGYQKIMNRLIHLYDILRKAFINIKHENISVFDIVSHDNGLPLVCVKINDKINHPSLTLDKISHKAKEKGWVFPVYPQAEPYNNIKIMRVVIREGFNLDMASKMIDDIKWAINEIMEDDIEKNATHGFY